MKKSLIIIICLLIAAYLLYPTKLELDDGGTVIYEAPLYEVHNVHSVVSFEKNVYRKGTIVEILGFEVFNNVK